MTVPMMRRLVDVVANRSDTGKQGHVRCGMDGGPLCAAVWGGINGALPVHHDPSVDLTRANIVLSGMSAAEGKADATTQMRVHI